MVYQLRSNAMTPTPDYQELDRRLSVIHQQHLTHQMNSVQQKLKYHEREMMLLTLVVVAVAASVCYSEYRINRMEEIVYALEDAPRSHRRVHYSSRR